MKPMLAAAAQLASLRFPLLASVKLDGVRALIVDGRVMSRNFKPIPNAFVQISFGLHQMNGWDGELIVGAANTLDVYRRTVSGVMAAGGRPAVSFHVFDNFNQPHLPYVKRQSVLGTVANKVYLVPQKWIGDTEALLAYEEEALNMGYEGLMLRSLDGPYKYGRSTEKEGYLLKLKRFEDSEGKVIAVEELMHNENPATRDALGRTERSSHKENLRRSGKLGALVLEWKGKELRVGSGFTDEQRVALWKKPLTGKIAKFKYLAIGMKDLPRHPVFLGWRDRRDA